MLLSYTVKTVGISTFAYLTILAGAKLAPAYFLYNHQPIIIFYFLSISILGHIGIYFLGNKPEKFTLVYLSISTTKLLLSFSLVAFIAVKMRDSAFQFACNFLSAYLFFMIFEISETIKFLKQDSSSKLEENIP